MEITEENCQDLFPSKTIVYLSPDAEEGQIQVSFSCIYIFWTRGGARVPVQIHMHGTLMLKLKV